MGRRKIEIRAIRDDRNRSVTFLKRKGGLFKKAYELGVLCSVDVAVIIFGNNKKLYQFSSGDINETLNRYQYHSGAPHEHKGPADFEGKGGKALEWEDEDELDDTGTNEFSPPVSHMRDTPEPMPPAHHLQHQHPYQHMRQATASASPPMRHMSLQRSMTPQSQAYSRPASRMASGSRRTGSGMHHHQQGPPQHHHHHHAPPPPAHMSQYPPPHHQDSYSFTSNPASSHYPPPPPAFALPPLQSAGPPPTRLPPPPQEPYESHMHSQAQAEAQAQAHHYHMQQQQQYMEQERHGSVPPSMSSQHSPPNGPPQLEVQSNASSRNRVSPRINQTSAQTAHSESLLQPRAVPPHGSSTHSIFTPIDDSRSLLAQNWGGSSAGTDIARSRSAADVPSHTRSPLASNIDPQIAAASAQPHNRSRSASVASPKPDPQGLARSETMQSDAKRPRLRLKVQIPGEGSDGEGASAAPDSVAVSTAPPTSVPHQNKSVVLPPPSPSTRNPLLSAGATGPYNPFAFAKPQIPANSSSSSNNNNNSSNPPAETPLSALPSRVMDGNMLPSPSDLWNNMWGNKQSDNMMPSPLNFQNTPIFSSAPGFRELAPSDERKRRAENEATPAGLEKRIKT